MLANFGQDGIEVVYPFQRLYLDDDCSLVVQVLPKGQCRIGLNHGRHTWEKPSRWGRASAVDFGSKLRSGYNVFGDLDSINLWDNNASTGIESISYRCVIVAGDTICMLDDDLLKQTDEPTGQEHGIFLR